MNATVKKESPKFLALIGEKIRELHAAGINPIPAYGEKAPKGISPKAPIGTWKEWQSKRIPAAEIDRIVSRGPESVGVITGSYAGNLEALDFDSMDAFDRFLKAARLCGVGDLIDRIATGYDELSPKGRHWLYRIELAPGETMPGNEKWARGKPNEKGQSNTLIETRGEGGFIIVAPSFNGTYAMKTGGVESIVTIKPAERDQLKAVAAMVCENPEPEKPQVKNKNSEPKKPGKGSALMPASSSKMIKVSDGPISAFNNGHTWKEILTADGWTELHTVGAKTYWKRPGKDEAGCSGVSGPGGKATGDSFTCFSSNGPEWLPVGSALSRFDYVMHRDHGGNRDAFLVALRGELKPIAAGTLNGIPDLVIDFDETRVTADAFKILKGDQWLYRKGTAIVTPTIDVEGGRQSKFLALVQVTPAFIRSRIMQRCRPVKDVIGKGGEIYRVPCGYPEFLSKAIEATAHNGELNPLPAITGILQGPVINERGELVNHNGYHMIGGLGFYQTGAIEGLTLPEKLTKKDAGEAIHRVLDLLTDFGFVDFELDPLKWVAMILTQLVRPIIDFCPIWIVTANTSRAGKTILVDGLGLICHGMRPARTGFPQNPDRRDEELGKILSGFAFEGRSLLTFDNISDGTQVKSDELCRNATSEMIQNRQLHGHNQLGGMNVGQYILNGNNISPASDIIGRTVLIQVKCNDPNPGMRNSKEAFKHGPLDKHIEKNRVAILRDFLTIAAAYIRNGRPETFGKSIAGFDSWTNLVCGSIRWASGLDPIHRTNEETRAFDEQTQALGSLVINWIQIFGDLGIKARQVFKKISAEDPDDYASGLGEALAILHGGTIRNEQNVSSALRKFRDKKVIANGEPDHVYTIIANEDRKNGGFTFQVLKAVRQ